MLTLGPLWRGWIEQQFDDAHMTGKSLLCAPVIPCRKGSFSKWCQKLPFVAVNFFLLQDISLFCWYFDHIWWYLVISSVFAPNMKAGKGRRYLLPRKVITYKTYERRVVTMTVMMMVTKKNIHDDENSERSLIAVCPKKCHSGPNSVTGLQSTSVFLKEIVYPCWM